MKLRTSLRALLVAPLALPLASLLTPSSPALAAPVAASKIAPRFAFPSGRIVYQVSGMGAAGGSGAGGGNGTIDMKWANHGAQFRQDIQMTMGRPGTRVPPVNTWMIFDGKAMYMGLPAGMGTGGKMALKMAPNAAQLKQMTGGGMAGTSGTAGKLVGKATLLGKPCDIRLVTTNTPKGSGQAKLWLWQGLPLRTEVTSKAASGQSMKMTMVATKVDTALKPAPSLFKVPAGYKVQDMSAMLGQAMSGMGKQR